MFGIDVSVHQAGLDMRRARAEGVEFVVVKAVASYLPHLTEAAGYREHVDRVIEAGIPGVGHYAIPNRLNDPEATADFMLRTLYRYERGHVLALDNEPLDTYATFWNDATCERFFRRLITAGIPIDRLWLYCPASLSRGQGPWPLVEALGVKIWWASYGGRPDGHTPDHVPNLGGVVSQWHVHQFTADADVAGNPNVDGDHSPLPLAALFGTGGAGMPRTLAGVVTWARANAWTMDWAGWCEKFINNSGAFNQAFSSALNAGSNSGALRGDWQNAPPGAIHYWAGAGGFGHDAWELGGGLLLMASSSVSDDWGNNLGTVTFLDYARKGLPYRGWTMRHGTETLRFAAGGGSPAGDGGTPIPEEDIMASLAEMEAAIKRAVGSAVGSTMALDPGQMELLRDADRRENRGRLVFDAGPQGTGTIAEAKLAMIGAVGRVQVLPEDPEVRQRMVDGIKARRPLQVPPGENWTGLSTTAFFALVDWFSDPYAPLGSFVENVFELEGGDTTMVRSDREIAYANRSLVHDDGRPVRILKGGVEVEKFGIRGRDAVAVLVDGTTVVLNGQEITRANAQRVDGQTWVTIEES